MSVVIGDSLVLSQAAIMSPNQARLCWRTFVDAGSVSVTSQSADNPITNVANPSTSFVWQAADTAQQDIDIIADTQVDYIGIARHNLDQGSEIRVQFLIGVSYVTIFDWQTPPNSQVILYFINNAEPDEIRISIRNNSAPPIIGVIYAGVSTMLQRRIYVGHTPIVYGRDVQTVGAYSENGQYLGELIRKEGRSTQVALQNLTPDWYREELDPFIAQRPRRPAFWAWRPGKYSAEVGYVWLTGSPRMRNQRPNGMVEITMDFEGIA